MCEPINDSCPTCCAVTSGMVGAAVPITLLVLGILAGIGGLGIPYSALPACISLAPFAIVLAFAVAGCARGCGDCISCPSCPTADDNDEAPAVIRARPIHRQAAPLPVIGPEGLGEAPPTEPLPARRVQFPENLPRPQTMGALLKQAVRNCGNNWDRAVRELFEESILVEANENPPDGYGGPSCHPRLFIGGQRYGYFVVLTQQTRDNANIGDELSYPCHQRRPIDVKRGLLLGDLSPENTVELQLITEQLMARYAAEACENSSLADLIYTYITEVIQEGHVDSEDPSKGYMDPSRKDTLVRITVEYNEMSQKIARLVTYRLLLDADVQANSLVMGGFTLHFGNFTGMISGEFLPTALTSTMDPEEESMVTTEALEAAVLLKDLPAVDQAAFLASIYQGELLQHRELTPAFRMIASLIGRRYLGPYLASANAAAVPAAPPNLINRREWEDALEQRFGTIEPDHSDNMRNCFYDSVRGQLSLTERQRLGYTSASQVTFLREQASAYILAHPEEFGGPSQRDALGRLTAGAEYEAEMARRDWSGPCQVKAIAHVLDRPIHLYDKTLEVHALGPDGQIQPDELFNPNGPNPPLYILGEAHYRILQPRR